MKQIDISTPKFPNTFAMVSDKDYPELILHKWRAKESRKTIYAVAHIKIDGITVVVRMHRFILQCKKGDISDHRNRNGLDNQRHNLRKCTTSQNNRNKSKQSNNTSGYIGVWYEKRKSRYKSYISTNNVSRHIHYSFCPVRAASIRDAFASALHGKFASLNLVSCNCDLPKLDERLAVLKKYEQSAICKLNAEKEQK